jgi:putative transposase
MPRQARIDAPGALHHIIARGIERGKIFRDDQDRDFFVTRLGDLVVRTQTKCLAWALIPNHFHLLLKTGTEPIAGLMRRLLTSVAVTHNRRHGRSGHVFQNRYKSILCQEDAYLKALVRYIHLNPLRSGIVKDIGALDRYRFAGHSFILGKEKNAWQSVNEVLAHFGPKKRVARGAYREFVIAGIELGRQPDLVGGGLIRSAGGWAAVRSQRKAGLFQKSDERILGDGDFVDAVLNNAQASLDKRHSLAAKGIQFEDLFAAVSALLSVQPRNLLGPSKERTIVKARALCCYWAVRELGMSMSNVAGRLKIAGPTVSVAVKKGGKIVSDEGLVLSDVLNIRI